MTVLNKRKTFLDLFPTPEFLLLSTVGIVITDLHTKFVQLRREIFGDGFRLVHLDKSDNPKGAIESGLIKNPEAIRDILKKFALGHGVRYAHATLPEEKAYLFTASIDRVPLEGLRDAVAFIIEGNAPVSLSESVFDFEIINKNESVGDIKLAVSVLPESIVNSYIELFESAGITPISFDLESQAVARAVIRPGDKSSNLIVNLSREKTGFYVIEESVVQFSTTFSYGVGEDDSYPNLNDLKEEVHKVFAFWSARSGKNIEKVILCGPGSNKEDFIMKLMSESSVEHNMADAWLNMSPTHSHAPEILDEESVDYAPAIGLVLPRMG